MEKTTNRCVLREITNACLVSAAFPLGTEKKFAMALKKAYGMPLPAGTMSEATDKARTIRSTVDQVLLLLHETTGQMAQIVAKALDETAYTTDQTDGWVILEISGEGAKDALARICPIDLDPSVFPLNGAARTTMEHMGTTIIRTGDDSFLLLSASSSARSFAHAVEQSMDYTS